MPGRTPIAFTSSAGRSSASRFDELSPRADGQPYTTLKTFVQDRPGHDRRYAIDCTKINRELGWNPAESFATGLRKTVEWYLANRGWCADISSGKYRQERLGVLS